MTALEMITRALRLSNVIDEIEDPSAEQGADGLSSLNDMMGQWDRDGIKMQWQQVAALSDELPLDAQDQRAVRFNLAVELAGDYGIDPLPRVQRISQETYDALAKAHRFQVESKLDHLPHSDGYWNGGDINNGGF